MAGEGQLRARREDAHAARVGRIRGREDERRLRVVELARDVLQPVLGDAGGVGEDGELVAAEQLVGEDVGGQVAVAGHAGNVQPGWRARLAPSRTHSQLRG